MRRGSEPLKQFRAGGLARVVLWARKDESSGQVEHEVLRVSTAGSREAIVHCYQPQTSNAVEVTFEQQGDRVLVRPNRGTREPADEAAAHSSTNVIPFRFAVS
jgi:hypothetical protein